MVDKRNQRVGEAGLGSPAGRLSANTKGMLTWRSSETPAGSSSLSAEVEVGITVNGVTRMERIDPRMSLLDLPISPARLLE